jgi:nucleotide-binding universal stress UspA family protein
MLESIRKMIVPTDFSSCSQAALETAARLAEKDDATIHLLHSIRLPLVHTTYDVNVPESVWEKIRKGTRERMYDSQLFLEEAGVSQVELIVSEYRQPEEAVEHAAKELAADLVVMATHGRRGLQHAFLGSVCERTIRTSPIPVLAVKTDHVPKVPLERILLPTDFSSCADEALHLAESLATRYGARIDVLHVRDRTPEFVRFGSSAAFEYEKQCRNFIEDRLDAIIENGRAKGLLVAARHIEGVAADEIADEAARLESDLIVMGTHGYRGFQRAMLGSVTERTLRLARCSVLTT